MFIHVIATRPNFIKFAPVFRAMNEIGLKSKVVHTGQHYDYKMSDIFMEDLKIKPDWHLGIKGGDDIESIAKTMVSCKELFLHEKPTAIIVYGDVNATLAAALAANKVKIPIIHVESGCRSGDKTMPEEVNRILVDNITDLFFCTDYHSLESLYKEGHVNNIEVVGNTAIDALYEILEKINDTSRPIKYSYALCTLHRQSNVDDIDRLYKLLNSISKFDIKIVLPAHPRLLKNILKIGAIPENIELIDPLGYTDFINHLKHCKFVITDSGGIQCETGVLRKTCFLLRDTIEHKVAKLYGTIIQCPEPEDLEKYIDMCLPKTDGYKIPDVWDGEASKRIANIIKEKYGK